MLKKALVVAVLGAGALGMLPTANAGVEGFTGNYAFGNWTTTLNGTPAGGGGATVLDGSPNSVTLVGGDDFLGCTSGFGTCTIDFTIQIAAGFDQPVSFHWAYHTDDALPAFDKFGYVINGAFTQLPFDFGSSDQSGDVGPLALNIGDFFGWRINCQDCLGGAATATISQFAAAPEPGSLALLGLGLAGLAGARKRRLAA